MKRVDQTNEPHPTCLAASDAVQKGNPMPTTIVTHVPSRLREEILARSVADTWDAAKLEWALSNVFLSDTLGTCLCGHPITKHCVLANQLRGYEVVVGNVCLEQFTGLSSERLFASLRRISADIGAALSTDAIELACDQGWLSEWETTFYRDTRKKRRLTERQLAKRQQINSKVLARCMRGVCNA